MADPQHQLSEWRFQVAALVHIVHSFFLYVDRRHIFQFKLNFRNQLSLPFVPLILPDLPNGKMQEKAIPGNAYQAPTFCSCTPWTLPEGSECL